MKKLITILWITIFTVSCEDDDNRLNNPNLPNISFSININLDLPQFNSLKFPGNVEVITTDGIGIKGIIIYNVDNTQYIASELSDPNIPPNNCSALKINGIIAESNCGNDNEYNIVTGQQIAGQGGYPLLNYKINRQGNTLFLSN